MGKEKPKAFPSLISNGRLELVVLFLAHLRILNFALIVVIGDLPLGILALVLRAVLRILLLTVLRRRVVGILVGLVFAVVLILIVAHFVYRPFPILFFAGDAQIYRKILDFIDLLFSGAGFRIQLLPVLFRKLFYRRTIGVVDHFEKLLVREAGKQVYRVKIRLLDRRAVAAPRDGVGKSACCSKEQKKMLPE